MKSLSGLIVLVLACVALGYATTARAADDPALALFKKSGCNTCHAISALNVAKAEKKATEAEPAAEEKAATATEKPKKDAPDLSGAGLEHDAKWISGFINKTETTKDGDKHEKRFKGSEADRRTLAMWLATLKHEVKKPAADEKTDSAPKKE
jgi:cytochrome c551/c552